MSSGILIPAAEFGPGDEVALIDDVRTCHVNAHSASSICDEAAGSSPVASSWTARSLLRSDTLADSVAILLIMAVVQRLVGFGRSLLVCSWLEPEQLGEWDLANRFLVLAGPLVVLGLPGTFGRYLEYFRLQGSLRTVLIRTTTVCVVLSFAAVVTMFVVPDFFAEQVFGERTLTHGIGPLAFALVAVIAYNFLSELLIALRLVRIGAFFQFVNAVAFALFSVALLAWWQADAMAIVFAYGGSCLLLVLAAIAWTAYSWKSLPRDRQSVADREIWPKLLRFAMWVWIANLLANLYEIVGRYLLLHYGDLPDPHALIGQYHSAQVIPVLMISVASVLASMILPHLTHDWELGKRSLVGEKMNLTIKLFAIALMVGSAVVLLIAPPLFGWLLKGKYTEGLSLLPLTLAGCAWLSLWTVVQIYLWCAERAKLGCVALSIGLAVSVGLNLLWIPMFGLTGAVVATAVSNLVVLIIFMFINRHLGMQIQTSTWIMCMLPAVLIAGGTATWLLLIPMLGVAWATDLLLSRTEKQQLAAVLDQYAGRFRRLKSS